MELQFQKSQCRCLGRAVREVKNTELTQEVRLSDGMPDIGRVLGAWGQAVLRSKEWRAGQVSASGGVMTRILYAPEDGSEIRSLDTWIPFQIQWDIQNADRDGTLRVLPLLRFLDSRTVSARKIMVRAGIAAMAEALYGFDLIANGEGRAVQSASIGSVSVSYGSSNSADISPKSQARELYRCACLYLDIYRG